MHICHWICDERMASWDFKDPLADFQYDLGITFILNHKKASKLKTFLGKYFEYSEQNIRIFE